MRRAALILALTAGFVVSAAAAAPASSPPFLTARPNPVHFGETVTIKGRAWPIIEFCRRRVRLSLVSDQNAFVIGFSHISDRGRFTRRWTPRRSEVGAGRWRVVARLRCETGEDGKPNFIRRRAPLRIVR